MANFNAKNLTTAMRTASKFAASRAPVEIRKCVRIVADDHCSRFYATDGERHIKFAVDVETAHGELLDVCVNAKDLGQALRGAKGTVSLSTDPSGNLVVTLADGSAQSLATQPAAEFPEFPDCDLGADFWQSKTADFRANLLRVNFAADMESTRYALGGVQFDCRSNIAGFVDDRVTFAATDSRRLAIAQCESWPVGQPDSATGVVPSYAVETMCDALKGSDGHIAWKIRENDAVFATAGIVIVARLVKGRFPKYRDVIPPTESAVAVARIKAAELGQAMKRAIAGSSPESRGADFQFGNDNRLTVSVINSAALTTTIPLAIDFGSLFGRTSYLVTLDPAFLADFAATLEKTETVTLYLPENPSQAVRIAAGDNATVYIVMPLARDDDSVTPAAPAQKTAA